MSVQVMAWVLEEEKRTTGTERLVLLSLANHANNGWQCWPSVPRIAREANVSERAVQRAMVRLRELGIVQVIRNGAPDKRIPEDRRPNLYVIHRGDAAVTSRGDAGDTPNGLRGDAGGSDPVTLVTERGDAAVTQTVIDPSVEPSASSLPPSEGDAHDTSLAEEQVALNVTSIRKARELLAREAG